MNELLIRFWQTCSRLNGVGRSRQRGATAAEYGIIIAVVGTGIVFALIYLAGGLDFILHDAGDTLRNPPRP